MIYVDFFIPIHKKYLIDKQRQNIDLFFLTSLPVSSL